MNQRHRASRRHLQECLAYPGNGEVRADQPNTHRSKAFLFFPLLQGARIVALDHD
jgi:hypothetical protein